MKKNKSYARLFLTGRYSHTVVLGLIILSFVVSCGRRASPFAATRASLDDDPALAADEMDFIEIMVTTPKCTVAHAVKAVAILVNDADVATTHQGRYRFLLDRDIIRPEWRLDPDQWIDRGTLSYMLCKAIGIRGGVNMILFGSNGLGDRRYAYRELRYRKLIQEGVDYNYVSGPELVTAIGKIDRYRQKTGRYALSEEVELGQKPQKE